MADEKTPLDHALDVLVYAPFGLALSVRDLLPQLAEKGKQQLTGQVTMAKMVGQFAVQQGQTEAGKAFEKARDQAQSTLEQLTRLGGPAPSPADVAAPSTNNGARAVTEQPAAETQPVPATSGPEAGALAIPGYDSLAASQVVPRLTGLAADELEAVRAYESSHRGRRTILNRIAQLQA
jgi:hypothetical protein